MDGEPNDITGTRRRWEQAVALLGILVILSFIGFLTFLLLFAGVEGGHAQPAGGHVPPAGDQTQPGGAQDGSASSLGGHRPPDFLRSFGFTGLALVSAYLAALAVWAGWRRKWVFLVRHLVSAAVMLLLVVAYLNTRGGFGYNGHDWNRSFADASVVLYAATLSIGPLARLWRPASQALAWRRETGIWATIAAAMHVGIFWEWSLGWDWRPLFLPGTHGNMVDTGFNLANVVGLVALVYALVLTVTSNEASQRWLKSGWSWLQERSTTMWLLVLLHGWLFAFYITGEKALPLATLWAGFWVVLLLQTAAFGKAQWLRRTGSAGMRKSSVTSN